MGLRKQACYVMLTENRKTSRLSWHLLRYFRKLFLLQAAWSCVSGFFTIVPTILIRAILQYVEDPGDTPTNVAWLYVILLVVASCVTSLSNGQALWVGRKIYMRIQAVIIGEICAKALRRKAAAGSDTVLEEKDNDGKWTGTQANMGTIINLIAVDSFKVGDASAYMHELWAGIPVQIIVSVVLLCRLLGYSSIAGMGGMICLLPLNAAIAKRFSSIQKKTMAATDARTLATNEVLQNIRIIKFFAWEQRFIDNVNEKRSAELVQLRKR